jgi:hypothetical protein
VRGFIKDDAGVSWVDVEEREFLPWLRHLYNNTKVSLGR